MDRQLFPGVERPGLCLCANPEIVFAHRLCDGGLLATAAQPRRSSGRAAREVQHSWLVVLLPSRVRAQGYHPVPPAFDCIARVGREQTHPEKRMATLGPADSILALYRSADGQPDQHRCPLLSPRLCLPFDPLRSAPGRSLLENEIKAGANRINGGRRPRARLDLVRDLARLSELHALPEPARLGATRIGGIFPIRMSSGATTPGSSQPTCERAAKHGCGGCCSAALPPSNSTA